MINKDQLKEIIKDLLDVCEEFSGLHRLEFEIDYPTIFKEACSYHRGFIAKGCRKQIAIPQKPITDKQAAFLSELGYEGSFNLTSKQASSEIGKLKKTKEVKNEQRSVAL